MIYSLDDMRRAIEDAFEEGWGARGQFNHARRNTPLREDRIEERDAYVRRMMEKALNETCIRNQ